MALTRITDDLAPGIKQNREAKADRAGDAITGALSVAGLLTAGSGTLKLGTANDVRVDQDNGGTMRLIVAGTVPVHLNDKVFSVNVADFYWNGARVIERGSNANGDYVKFADGTLICTHYKPSIQCNPGGTTVVWYFPHAPAAGTNMHTIVNYEPHATQGYSVGKASMQLSSSAATTLWFNQTASQTYLFTFVAIGRWK